MPRARLTVRAASCCVKYVIAVLPSERSWILLIQSFSICLHMFARCSVLAHLEVSKCWLEGGSLSMMNLDVPPGKRKRFAHDAGQV